MPTNLTTGNSAQFTVEFLDINGSLTVPTSGALIITYPTSVGTTMVTLDLTPTGSFFSATWSSTPAIQGLVNWSVTAPGATPANSGQIRIIGP